MAVTKKLLAVFVLIAVMVSVGCISMPKTYQYTLPHAKEIIVVEKFKLSQGVRLGGSAAVPQIVVDFNTFQEHAVGTVYVSVISDYPHLISPTSEVKLGFYTLINGTLWVSYVIAEDAPSSYQLVVDNTTVIITKGG